MKKLLFLLLAALVLFTACTKDDNPADPVDNKEDVTVTENIKDQPVFYNVSDMSLASVFDLIFINSGRTLSVELNGGVSGSAGVQAINLGAVNFDDAAEMNQVFDTDKEGALVIGETWYNYDFTTHTITSKGEVYLIKGIDYNTYKFKIDNFADGTYTITFAIVDQDGKPTNPTTVDVAASEEASAYFSLATGTTVEMTRWDIAFMSIPLYVEQMGGYISSPGIRVNSKDGAGAAFITGSDFDEITTVPEGVNYMQDSANGLAIGDTWYEYDTNTHQVTPKEGFYLIKLTDGKTAKLKVTSYYHPETGTSGHMNFELKVLD